MPIDAAISVKRLPEAVAMVLGHDLVPAVEAFIGDGVPAHEVAKLSRHVRSSADAIVADCELVRFHLRCGGAEIEYSYMFNDDSLLEPLLRRSLGLAQNMLDMLDALRAVA